MPPSPDILAALSPLLDQALDLSPEELRVSFGELAELRSVSERTVQRDWRKARLLLHRLLQQ